MRTAITPPPDAIVPERSPLAPPAGTTVHGHYRACFGCGDASPDGLRMQITMGEGLTIFSEYAVTEAHQGAPGLAHGGVLGVAIDEMLGSCGYLIGTPQVAIDRLLVHRQSRENKVVEALRALKEAGMEALVSRVYDDVPVALHPMASQSLLAHLLKLKGEGRAAEHSGRWLPA